MADRPMWAFFVVSPREDVLGTPFIIMERLLGRVFFVWELHGSFSREILALRAIWLQAAQILARLHQLDWQAVLADWERPRPLRDEINTWMPLLWHAETPRTANRGREPQG